MPTQLDQILAHTLLEVNARKASADIAALERKAASHTPRGFISRMREVAATGPAIISEIKKASPSRGLIRAEFHPATLAKGFAENGAACLSVLTDQEFFQGSLADLEAASSVVSIPCLRKDFMLDPFQILEARAYGADCILLIVAAHEDQTLSDLRDEAVQMGLDVLCEVHDRAELDRAIDLGFDMIGVNSRDLRTFTMHPELLPELVSVMPAETVKVAESGLRTAEDIRLLREVGYHGFLIGETLMRQPDPAGTLALLLDRDYASEF
ncbi:MAG: indole-3-glycerol phosphate synthase TrpC [Edaphobacter sp.]|uniref:indole-3-glycerol phosphate synthase TrpC n=1 Tax=Edaphobacter sp. TaxID=1934404 RepID=UPI0023A2DD66|nr:indole-3-glycerol phosphate synthase TrpC [Edaphobacter sp.]MDE1178037.1 indole-3-glycerol phosphate synthase TrpC [Edaphobacter sp.]